jgi:hypothetical protein
MKTIQLFKDGKQMLASDGIMLVDGRFNNASIYREVTARNNRFAVNFPHKVADQYAVYNNGLKSSLGKLNNI